MRDEELIDTILQGNGERYADIVERYQKKLFQTAYYYSQNAEDARDLTQEILIKAYNSLGRFKFGSSFSTWLYRIAVNHCIDWLRKRRSHNEEEFLFTTIGLDEHSPEDVLFHHETVAEVQAAVRSLPEIYVSVVTLYYFEDFTPQQIADILDVTKRTVETRLFRARKLLREKIHGIANGGEQRDLSPEPGRLAQLR